MHSSLVVWMVLAEPFPYPMLCSDNSQCCLDLNNNTAWGGERWYRQSFLYNYINFHYNYRNYSNISADVCGQNIPPQISFTQYLYQSIVYSVEQEWGNFLIIHALLSKCTFSFLILTSIQTIAKKNRLSYFQWSTITNLEISRHLIRNVARSVCAYIWMCTVQIFALQRWSTTM